MKSIFASLIILAATMASASSFSDTCSTVDGSIVINRGYDYTNIALTTSEWVENKKTGEFDQVYSTKSVEIAAESLALGDIDAGVGYIIKDSLVTALTNDDHTNVPACQANEKPEDSFIEVGSAKTEIREITFAIRNEPFEQYAYPLGGNEDGSITRKFYCESIMTNEAPHCTNDAVVQPPVGIPTVGICTMDINQYGFSSMCSCEENYLYDQTIGQCKPK